MKLEYSAKAQGHLAKLPAQIAERIVDKMDWFVMQDVPMAFAAPLIGTHQKLYRYRIGDYRAICQVQSGMISILFVLTIKHRREAYK